MESAECRATSAGGRGVNPVCDNTAYSAGNKPCLENRAKISTLFRIRNARDKVSHRDEAT